MIFKEDLEKIIRENTNKTQHFSYTEKTALIHDLVEVLSEKLDERHSRRRILFSLVLMVI